jgi:hypothetical protein
LSRDEGGDNFTAETRFDKLRAGYGTKKNSKR